MTDVPTLHGATANDVPEIEALIRASGLHLAERGFRNWLPPYPGGAVRRDQEAAELYRVHLGETLVGTFALNADGGDRSAGVAWSEPEAPSLYLHRLAVWPDLQGRGLGLALLHLAERAARDRGAAWLRLEANADNAPLLRFYERAGYEARGHVRIEIGREDLPILTLTSMERRLL